MARFSYLLTGNLSGTPWHIYVQVLVHGELDLFQIVLLVEFPSAYLDFSPLPVLQLFTQRARWGPFLEAKWYHWSNLCVRDHSSQDSWSCTISVRFQHGMFSKQWNDVLLANKWKKLGYLIAASVAFDRATIMEQSSYKILFVTNWVWLLVIVLFCFVIPESPYHLV